MGLRWGWSGDDELRRRSEKGGGKVKEAEDLVWKTRLGLRMGGRRAEEGGEVGHGGRRPHLPEAMAEKSELEVEGGRWTGGKE